MSIDWSALRGLMARKSKIVLEHLHVAQWRSVFVITSYCHRFLRTAILFPGGEMLDDIPICACAHPYPAIL